MAWTVLWKWSRTGQKVSGKTSFKKTFREPENDCTKLTSLKMLVIVDCLNIDHWPASQAWKQSWSHHQWKLSMNFFRGIYMTQVQLKKKVKWFICSRTSLSEERDLFINKQCLYILTSADVLQTELSWKQVL